MIGGRVISVLHKPGGIVQLWCIEALNGSTDELAVDVLAASELPAVGEHIWWQSRTVFWANDTKRLVKVGNSYDPRNVE